MRKWILVAALVLAAAAPAISDEPNPTSQIPILRTPAWIVNNEGQAMLMELVLTKSVHGLTPTIMLRARSGERFLCRMVAIGKELAPLDQERQLKKLEAKRRAHRAMQKQSKPKSPTPELDRLLYNRPEKNDRP